MTITTPAFSTTCCCGDAFVGDADALSTWIDSHSCPIATTNGRPIPAPARTVTLAGRRRPAVFTLPAIASSRPVYTSRDYIVVPLIAEPTAVVMVGRDGSYSRWVPAEARAAVAEAMQAA